MKKLIIAVKGGIIAVALLFGTQKTLATSASNLSTSTASEAVAVNAKVTLKMHLDDRGNGSPIADAAVSVTLDGAPFTSIKTDSNGNCSFVWTTTAGGSFKFVGTFSGNKKYSSDQTVMTVNVTGPKPVDIQFLGYDMPADDHAGYYLATFDYNVTYGSAGKPAADIPVLFLYRNQTANTPLKTISGDTTDENGDVSISVFVPVDFEGDIYPVTLDVEATAKTIENGLGLFIPLKTN